MPMSHCPTPRQNPFLSSRPRMGRGPDPWLHGAWLPGLAALLFLAGLASLTAAKAAAAAEDCVEGTKLENGRCVPVARSADARCPRGTRRAGSSCEAIRVPEFASLNSAGSDFECWRGYERSVDTCRAIAVPENADLDSTGHGWKCRRGYRADGDACVGLEVPANASLDSSGNDWECWRGFRREGNECERVVVPRYANLDASGHAWECWPGYRALNDACERLDPKAYSAAIAASRREVDADEDASDPAKEPRATIRAAGLCNEEYVAGELEAAPGISGTDVRVVRGRLGGESGSSFEFEGELDGSGRLEGVDDRGRSCNLISGGRALEESEGAR